jgi:hypothetical protein
VVSSLLLGIEMASHSRCLPNEQRASSMIQDACTTETKGVAKDLTFAELKTCEIHRVIYPLNPSGSKQVIVSMDPDEDFLPIVTIGKPGWSGYRLSMECFHILVQNIQYINTYFDNPTDNYGPLHLSATETVEFRKNWGKHMIYIINKLDNTIKLCMAKPTWNGLVDVMPLLIHILGIYERHQNDAMQVFIGMATRLKQCLSPSTVSALPIVEDLKFFKDTLKHISFDSINYMGNKETTLNLETLFLEIRTFCSEHLASYIPYL